jgi:hypothetical protein
LPYSITARAPNTRTAYVQQFNLGIQRQLGSRAVLGASYVGSVGHKLPRLRDINFCTQESLVINLSVSPPTDFASILYQENLANSNYSSLQVGFQVRSFRGLQMEANYQRARSIDNASSLLPQVFPFNPPVAAIPDIAIWFESLRFRGRQQCESGTQLAARSTLRHHETQPSAGFEQSSGRARPLRFRYSQPLCGQLYL